MGPEALHEVDCGAVHRECPQTAVTCQSSVAGAAPVPHGSEDHLTEAAMQGVHVKTDYGRETTTGDTLMQLWLGLFFNRCPCYRDKDGFITVCFGEF